MTVSEEKRALREACLAARREMSAEERQAADVALCRHVAAHPAFADATLLLLFSPVRGEPDLTPLAGRALRAGTPVAFPCCEGEQMHFHLVGGLDELRPARFGIPTPASGAPLARTDAGTLCILPGLAAGRDGSRLGYGGGFYDRFLTTFGGITLFPIYERLVFPTLPTEATDTRVHHLITEKGEIPLCLS